MCQTSLSSKFRGGGMSFMSPFAAPWSAQAAIVAISSSVSDGSSLNFWMPMFRSMCQGGIMRAVVRVLISRAYGRTSS